MHSFISYAGVDSDPDVIEEVHNLATEGKLKQFDSYADVAAFVQGTPVISKMAVIVKTMSFRLSGVPPKLRVRKNARGNVLCVSTCSVNFANPNRCFCFFTCVF